jgi:hypothetical protein
MFSCPPYFVKAVELLTASGETTLHRGDSYFCGEAPPRFSPYLLSIPSYFYSYTQCLGVLKLLPLQLVILSSFSPSSLGDPFRERVDVTVQTLEQLIARSLPF